MAIYTDPNVYQNEIDQSYVRIPAEKTGLSVIGRTSEGQAFVPTKITSIEEYYDIFGYPTGYDYTAYTVKNYLKYGESVLVTRIMSEKGYIHPNLAFLVIDLDTQINNEILNGSQKFIYAMLHRSVEAVKQLGNNAGISAISINDLGNYEYQLDITLSNGNNSLSESYIFSINPLNKNYINKVFSQNENTNRLIYLYNFYDEALKMIFNEIVNNGLGFTLNYLLFEYNFDNRKYQSAETPYIISQTVNNTNYQLFKIKTLSQGTKLNKKFKVVIQNIRYANEVENNGYGLFDIVIRAFDDNDKDQNVLEYFEDLDLNPNSVNYILRKIGDKHIEIINGNVVKVGDYENKSRYIYIEVTDDVKNGAISPELIPMGFEPILVPYTNSAMDYSYPRTKYITTPISTFFGSTMFDDKVVLGYDFSYYDNKEFLLPIPNLNDSNPNNNLNDKFLLENCIVPNDAPVDAGLPISESSLIKLRKFAVPFQNGFDGEDPALYKAIGDEITTQNMMGWDFTNGLSEGTQLYKKALDILSNKDIYDFDLLVTPGLIYRLHPAPMTIALDMVEKRGDVFYIMDLVKRTDNIDTIISVARTLDTNYAGTYYPYVKYFDDLNNKYLWVPPSVTVVQVYAFNDKYGKQWDAPAGLNRGLMENVIDVYMLLNSEQRGELYKNRINPITVFNEGIVIWGQKTLQKKSSALDRINVRRLLINLKKFVNEKLRYFVFEKNSALNRNLILNILSPYFDMVRQSDGLYDYKIIVDDTINTGEVIDRNELRGKIYIKPTKTAEFIVFDWNIVGTNFNLNNI